VTSKAIESNDNTHSVAAHISITCKLHSLCISSLQHRRRTIRFLYGL